MTRTLTDTLTSFRIKPKSLTVNILNGRTRLLFFSLKKRTKHAKRFYKNPSDYNKDLLKADSRLG